MRALALTLLCAAVACQKATPPVSKHMHHEQPAAPAAGPAADFSLYHLASTWTDQNSAPRELSSLRGRVQLISMVYTSCGDICPRVVADMKRIEAAVPDVGFVLVSIDPERDTPSKLAEFAAGARLDSARYTLLNGSDADLLELAAALGVRYRKVKPGEFVHSAVISVLDEAGNVVYQQQGFDNAQATIEFLRGR